MAYESDGKGNWRWVPDYQSSISPTVAAASTRPRVNLSAMFGKLWNKGSGIQPLGIGRMSNIGSAISQGTSALQGLSQISNNKTEARDIQASLLRESLANPIANSYLSEDQKTLLNKIRRGSYDPQNTGIWEGIGSGLGDAVKSALTGGAIGGIPGAVIGGVGSLANSGIQGYSNAQQRSIGELEALYQTLADANAQYQTMKRPNFTGLGIQRRYTNMYS